ncbi:glutamate ABC transporter substrate-binding protein [Rhodococcus sp. T2V]|uniref:glutamate ABC transporter substrate-binding protein n=1 Tax=Rhodococcus sp. T2V TaxID=3034164 RepID=UPI0023E29F1C|nr:glutamate ABC transporter substrate-binding protein [Rhodococcus sp. T2V]MDF3310296.1 glutamate ABC transporter substrate-binding protein [Rhodococcus sp. T2V]
MRGLVGVLVTAVAVLAGCGSPAPDAPAVTGDYSELSLPNGTQIIPPSGLVPPAPVPPSTCGALASLRPGPPVPAGAVPPRRLVADIVARDRLIVGVDQDTNLFSFRDPTTDTLEGFDVDVAREVARDLLGDPAKVEFRLLTPGGRLDALEKNQVDIVAQTMTITCQRAERVAFSTVYLEAYQRVLVTDGSGIAGSADLAGRRVCAATDTTSLATIRRVQPQATIVAVPDWADCLMVLQQRQADAVSTDDAILAGLAAQDPTLEIVGSSLETQPYGIGINKTNTDLVRLVNGTLDRLRVDGTWMKLHDRWLTVLGPVTGPPTPIYRD